MAMELLWYGGHNPEMFDEPERTLELFHCGICLMVCKDMVETKCGHVFCEDCLQSWRMTKKVCPIDRISLENEDDFYPIVSMRRHIEQFMVSCPRDCGAKFQLKELQEHIELRCPNTEEIKYEDYIVWKGIRDFGGSEVEYATYLQRTLKKGMMLRSRETYEKVKKGDYGIFIQYNGGTPPCQVRWQNFGHKYWLPWKHIEIAELTSKNAISKKREIMQEIEQEKLLRRRLKPGMRVMATCTFQSVCQGDIGEFVQYNEKYPPVQVRWEGFGNTYWVFWKSLEIIDGMSDAEIEELRISSRPVVAEMDEKELEQQSFKVVRSKSHKKLEDFTCELEYANYMKSVIKPGTLVRTVRDYEQVKRGDIGLFEQSNTNYPPCQVRWTRFGHKYWVYWKDLEIVDALDDTEEKLELSLHHEKVLREHLKPGTKVIAVKPYRCVLQGDVGEFVESNERYPPVKVRWENYGSTYWVFWDNIQIIDGLSEPQVKALLVGDASTGLMETTGNVSPRIRHVDAESEYKTMDDFGSELEYANYMQNTLEEGMVLRAVRDYEQIKAGDMGLYLQFNKNYPPVQIRWKDFGHNYWFFWRDLEIVTGEEADEVKEDLSAAVAHEEDLKSRMEQGVMVMSLTSYQCIAQGDVGMYMQHNDRYPPVQVRWKHYGDRYWTFWKDLVIIDGMSDEEISELKRKHRPTVEEEKYDATKGLNDFDSEAEYIDWLRGEIERRSANGETIRVVAVNSFGNIEAGDEGVYMMHNMSYPPCLIQFERANKKKWTYWKDIQLLE